jgi:hypothetical protein
MPSARVVGFSQGQIVGAEVPSVKERAVPHELEFDADLGPMIEQLGRQGVHVVPKLPQDDSRRRQLGGSPPPGWQCVGFVVSVRLSQVHRFLVPERYRTRTVVPCRRRECSADFLVHTRSGGDRVNVPHDHSAVRISRAQRNRREPHSGQVYPESQRQSSITGLLSCGPS